VQVGKVRVAAGPPGGLRHMETKSLMLGHDNPHGACYARRPRGRSPCLRRLGKWLMALLAPSIVSRAWRSRKIRFASLSTIAGVRLRNVAARRTITLLNCLAEDRIRLGLHRSVDFSLVIIAEHLFGTLEKLAFLLVHMGAIVRDLHQARGLYRLSRHKRPGMAPARFSWRRALPDSGEPILQSLSNS
jgi:hypothetical protein